MLNVGIMDTSTPLKKEKSEESIEEQPQVLKVFSVRDLFLSSEMDAKIIRARVVRVFH